MKSNNTKPYGPEEIDLIAKRIEAQAEYFNPTSNELYAMLPALSKLGYAPVLKSSVKFMVASLIIDRKFELMYTDQHPPQFINRVVVFEVLEEVSQRLPNSFIRASLDRQGITWFSSGKVDFISDRFSEDDLADQLIGEGSNRTQTVSAKLNNLNN